MTRQKNGPGAKTGTIPLADEATTEFTGKINGNAVNGAAETVAAFTALHVPELPDDADTLTAALAYVEAGWYVLPVRRGSKKPGSVVGEDWQHKSSREPKVIVAWFAGTDHGIALHCGRSGALVFDVDDPERLPAELAEAIAAAPYQSSRPATPGRGHYVFCQPARRTIGNSVGQLGNGWGEVRGLNGVIIAAPSQHKDHQDGARYRWERAGALPELPDGIAEKLNDVSPAEDAATDEQVAAFIAGHTGASRPEVLRGLVSALSKKFSAHESRHDSAVSVTAGAMKEARIGLYSAKEAIDALRPMFLTAVAKPAVSDKQNDPRTAAEADSEWAGILAWAIGQAIGADLDEIRARVDEKMPESNTAAGSLSDARISEQLVERVLRGKYCWSNGLGWMRWDGTKWETATREAIVEQSRRFAKRLLGEAVRSDAGPDTIRVLTRRLTAGAVGAAADLAKGQLLVDATAFDAHPDVLNVANGVVDLRTGKLGDHNPDLLLTKCAPTNYHPDATHRDWNKALTALPATVAGWLQIRFGQAITGHPTPDDVLPVLHGSGANGKTTLTTAIIRALGEHATVVPDRVLLANPGDHPTEMMTLRGARLALLEETPEARHLNVKRLKDVLGTPQMTARLIRRDSVTWNTTHSLFVSTNYRPRVEETDHGTWRRLALVTFGHVYRTKGEPCRGPDDRRGDPTLRDRLKDSPEGQHEAVLAWLVTGAVRWYADNRVLPSPPGSVANDTRGWRHESDLILRWFDDTLIAEPKYYIPAAELYENFASWLNANGHQKWTSQTFADRFGQHDEIVSNRIAHMRIRLSTTWSGGLHEGLTASRELGPFGLPKTLPERFRAWIGVRFRTVDDDLAESP